MNIQGVDMRAMPANGLTELDRLQFVVHSIDNNCQIIPNGAFKKNTLGEVSPNDAFSGLEVSKLEDLNCYMHLRPVEQSEKKELCAREEDIFNHEFLYNVAVVSSEGPNQPNPRDPQEPRVAWFPGLSQSQHQRLRRRLLRRWH